MKHFLRILFCFLILTTSIYAEHSSSGSGGGGGLSDNAVLEAHLKAVNSATDEFCLTYESTVGDFEWQVCSAGSGDITDVGSCNTGNCANEGGVDIFPLIFEGTANLNETTFDVTDPTTDRTFTFGDDGGQVCTDANTLTLTNKTIDESNTVSINAADIIDENAGTDITADLEEESHASEHDGSGISISGETVNTASQEANFLADGGVTSLTCGASNPGKLQVMDDGSLEYCDGAATPVLQSGFLDVDGVDAIGTDTLDDLSDNNITDLSDVSAISGNSTTVGTTTGTLTNGNCAEFDVNGNIVDSGNACTGFGDNITVNATTAVDANFLDGDIDWTLNGVSNPDDITATVECTACISDADAANDLTISAGTIEIENSTMTNALDDEVLVGDGANSLAYIVLPDSDGVTQKLQYDQATNSFSAGTDDDVPESGDFGAAADLDATGAYNVDSVDYTEVFYGNTLAGNPGLLADECFPMSTITGGGFVCEGSLADTSEQLYLFPDVNGIDTTNRICVDDKEVTDLEGAGLSITAGTLNVDHDAADNFVANEHIDWTLASQGTIHATNYIDDDVPEAGDFAAGTDFDLNGALNTDSVSANELNATGVEAELEAVLDLADLQEKDIDSLTGQSDIDTGFTFDGVVVDLDGGTAEATLRLPNSASLPGTCAVGDTYWDTDADTDGSLYICRATNIWKEVDDDGGAGGGNAWTTIGTATADVAGDLMTVTDSLSIDITTTNDPEDLTAAFRYDQTQAGNPALSAEECVFSTDGTGGGGILCEGTTADVNEGLIQWNPTTDKIITIPDATDTLVGRATTDTLTNKTIDTTNTVTINASDITDQNAGTDVTADLEEEGVTCTDCIDLAKLDDDAGTPTAGDIISVRAGATDVTYTTPNAGTDITADLEEDIHASEHDGSGISVSGETLNTASGEANFLVDGGATSLTCGASNQGKMQVMDDGALQYCDGATTSVLADGFLDADGTDDDIPEAGDFGAATDLDGNGALVAGAIDATNILNGSLCGTNEILEDQGGSWACIATPTGGSLPVADTTSIAEGSVDNTKEVRFEVDGNTTGIVGVLATQFTTAKTLTLPDATDTLVGRATTDTLTNKTIDTTNTVTINASDITDQNAGTDVTADLEEEAHAAEHDGVGTVNNGEAIDTASQEAGFLEDGGAVSLTCGAANQGKMQVMDDGSIEYCDGATTSVLASGFLDADGVDDDVPEAGDFGAATDLDLNGAYNLNSIDYTEIFYGNTLAANPALLVDECFPIATATGGGLICEGSTADANEMLFLTPDLNEADTTHRFVTETATQTLTNKTIDATNTVTINASDITDQNAGTDITADLEEEAHAAEHESGGADQITLDGLDAGAATTRTNESKILIARHDTDCTSLTDGVAGELCYEEDADKLYMCEPTAGGCDTAAEWRDTAVGGAGVWQDDGTTISITNNEFIDISQELVGGDDFIKWVDTSASAGFIARAYTTNASEIRVGRTEDAINPSTFISYLNTDQITFNPNVAAEALISPTEFSISDDMRIAFSDSANDATDLSNAYFMDRTVNTILAINVAENKVNFEMGVTPGITTASDGAYSFSDSATDSDSTIDTQIIRGAANVATVAENDYFAREVDAGLTASATQTQGQGALTCETCQVSTVTTANDVVTLPTAVAGLRVEVINDGANTLQIFPASGDDLGAGLNTSTTLTAGNQVRFVAYDATNWEQDTDAGGTPIWQDDGATISVANGEFISQTNLNYSGGEKIFNYTDTTSNDGFFIEAETSDFGVIRLCGTISGTCANGLEINAGNHLAWMNAGTEYMSLTSVEDLRMWQFGGIGWSDSNDPTTTTGGWNFTYASADKTVNHTEDTYLGFQVDENLSASATQTQGQGALTCEICEVITVATANDVVTLPTAVGGISVFIVNDGANTLQIFPASGDNLGAGLNNSTTLVAGDNVRFTAYDATNWEQDTDNTGGAGVWSDDGTTISITNGEKILIQDQDLPIDTELFKWVDDTSDNGFLLECSTANCTEIKMGLTNDNGATFIRGIKYQNNGFTFMEGAQNHAYLDDYFALASGGDIGWVDTADAQTGTMDTLIRRAAANVVKPGENDYFAREVDAGLTASATQTQGNGALNCETCQVSTVTTANDVVTLPTAVAGLRVEVINDGANTLQIFPASGDNLGAGVDTSTTLTAGNQVRFVAYDATNWKEDTDNTGALGADAVGTTELDDDANTPTAGYFVVVETGAASFDYVSQGRSLTTTGTALDADAELYTDSFHGLLESPALADDAILQWQADSAITITRVDCWTDTETVTIQLDERALTTPNTAGTDIMTSTLICDNNNQNTTSFTNAGIAENSYVSMDVDAISAPGNVKIKVEFTRDD